MERLAELCFPSSPDQLRGMRTVVKTAVSLTGIGSEESALIVIAVNEACINVMQHAYKGVSGGEIKLELFNNGEARELIVHLVDFAAPVNVDAIRPRDLEDIRPGGLGTYFMREIMDSCEYGRLDGDQGNILRMTKKYTG